MCGLLLQTSQICGTGEHWLLSAIVRDELGRLPVFKEKWELRVTVTWVLSNSFNFSNRNRTIYVIHFLQEVWFFIVEMVLRHHNLDAKYAQCSWVVIALV